MEYENELIEKYEGLIYKIAKRFYNVELADLYQAGRLGLIKAARKYKKEIGTPFKDFAYLDIFGEMYELANKSRDIKLSKYYLQLYKRIQIAKGELINTLNREPSIYELSLYMELEESLIAEVITLTTSMLSLDAEYEKENSTSSIIDTVGIEPNYDNKILIEESLKNLEPLEQDVIKIRYFKDYTQSETAEILGISQVKVSRLEQKGKQKIKEYIAS